MSENNKPKCKLCGVDKHIGAYDIIDRKTNIVYEFSKFICKECAVKLKDSNQHLKYRQLKYTPKVYRVWNKTEVISMLEKLKEVWSKPNLKLKNLYEHNCFCHDAWSFADEYIKSGDVEIEVEFGMKTTQIVHNVFDGCSINSRTVRCSYCLCPKNICYYEDTPNALFPKLRKKYPDCEQHWYRSFTEEQEEQFKLEIPNILKILNNKIGELKNGRK